MCHLKPIPFRGVNCSDEAGTESAYPEMVAKAKQSFTGILWDNIAQSPYATYKVKSPNFLSSEFTYLTDLTGVAVAQCS